MILPEKRPEHTGLVIYDLRDPAQWEQARRDRKAWGRARSAIHPLSNDVIAIEFRSTGAVGVSA